MKKILVVLIFTLIISCGGPVQTLDTTSKRTVKFLALGDSYTIGESVPVEERWPHQLADMLHDDFSVEVSIIAKTGWTTGELWEGIQIADPQGPYDMVSLLIGVNNQYRGNDINEYRDEFIFLLEKAVEYAGGNPNHVFVLSIPDWGVTPFASDRNRVQIAQEIDAFNRVNFEESKNLGVHYVDVTPVSRGALNDISLVAPDGLHPSGKMYADWAKLALPIARLILE